MHKTLSVAGLAALALACAPQANAQISLPLSVEVRGAAAFPTGDFGDNDVIDTGYGFEVIGKYAVTPGLAIYGGYDRFSFGLDEDIETDTDVTDSGFVLGGQLSLPLSGMTRFTPWLRAGAIYNQLSIEGSENNVSVKIESDRSLGFEVGGGLAIPLGQVVSITPGVRYRAYSADFDFSDFGEDENSTDVSYITAGVGLSFRF